MYFRDNQLHSQERPCFSRVCSTLSASKCILPLKQKLFRFFFSFSCVWFISNVRCLFKFPKQKRKLHEICANASFWFVLSLSFCLVFKIICHNVQTDIKDGFNYMHWESSTCGTNASLICIKSTTVVHHFYIFFGFSTKINPWYITSCCLLRMFLSYNITLSFEHLFVQMLCS